MDDLIYKTDDFLNLVLGVRLTNVRAIDSPPIANFLIQRYKLYYAQIYTQTFVLVVENRPSQEQFNSVQTSAQLRSIETALNCPIIYIVPQLRYSHRFQLIKRRIPFVVPKMQLYIPQLGMCFSNTVQQNIVQTSKLSILAQALILQFLSEKKYDTINTVLVRKDYSYTLTSIGRAFRELEHFGLGAIVPAGKQKLLKFKYTGFDLWEKALPYLQTPVRKTIQVPSVYYDMVNAWPNVYIGGETALARLTDLASPDIVTLSIYEKDYKELKNRINEPVIDEEDCFLLDLRLYPERSSTNDRVVGALSLYLQFRDNPDERIQLELRKMMENYKW